MILEIKDLRKSYASKQVLKGINLQFEKGKVYGIVGHNGAGKTTLFRCISEIETFDGQILSDLPKVKNVLGLLNTTPYFMSKITGAEYIRMLCQARKVDTGDLELNNIFELPLDEFAANYSTGMKKKLALTAVLLQQNEIYILDEPYNGVDIQSNMIISEIVHKLKILGKLVIISSHIFATLKETCDVIHLLDEGQISMTVQRDEFDTLEQKLKDFTVGDRVDRMNIK